MSIILNGTTGITAPAGTLNRSGDGDIITLEKDGVYKGLIGINGNDPYFGRRAGVGITAQNNKIRPADGDDGSGYDNAVDLGEPSYRFKNLYLSGGVYVGGTGSANHLDDYEEGTFTPILSSGFSSAPTSYASQAGRYVKIGNLVYFQLAIDPDGAVANASSVRISGLPFAAAYGSSNANGGASISYQAGFNTNATDVIHIPAATSELHIYNHSGGSRNGNDSGVNINNYFGIFGCYYFS